VSRAQFQGRVYYRTVRAVPAHTELMVYYGDHFARLLGIDTRAFHSSAVSLAPPRSEYIVNIDDDAPRSVPNFHAKRAIVALQRPSLAARCSASSGSRARSVATATSACLVDGVGSTGP
jgi:hypothetical protein